MRFGAKGGSIAVLTTTVLMTAACSSSGQVGAATGSTSGAGTSLAPSTSGGPSTSGSAAASSGGSSGGSTSGGKTLTTDQISALLLTDKDAPGYTFDASKDSTTVTSTSDPVTSGGSACQTFADAENGLSTKYGTTAEVDRQLTKTAEGHVIEDSVLAMPSSGQAGAMISDLTSSLQSCKNLSATIDGSPGSMQLSPVPQLMNSGQAGYVNVMTIGGKTVLMTADLVRVGSAVSVVALVGPNTSDTATLQQMGATMAQLSNIQVGRLKQALGTS